MPQNVQKHEKTRRKRQVLLELIPRFELGTSSLPKTGCHLADMLLDSGRIMNKVPAERSFLDDAVYFLSYFSAIYASSPMRR